MKSYRFLPVILLLILWIGRIEANIPYPIIFVHGLTSDHETWEDTIEEIQEILDLGDAYVFHACLNADLNNERAEYRNDVRTIGWATYDNENINGQIPEQARLFAINFNEDIFNDWVNQDYDHSNTASIYKQGYGLKLMIEDVLEITNCEKVILVGHSMGGLAIREYLQRMEGGNRKWWRFPNQADGHRVAKVVTTGTPHLGCNTWANLRDDPMLGPMRDDAIPHYRSEAVRDLRYSYTDRENDDEIINGRYLYGGDEDQLVVWDPDDWDNIWVRGYWNNDVNCNGREDRVTGLNELVQFNNEGDIVSGTFNDDMPLPDNLLYTWIVSNRLGLGGDGVVDRDRQYLYDGRDLIPRGVANGLQIDAGHLAEPGFYQSIIMGLDESNLYSTAYEVKTDWTEYYGIFTPQFRNDFDTDVYVFEAADEGAGLLRVDLDLFEAMDLDNWMVSIHNEDEDAIAIISDRDPDNGLLDFDIPDAGTYYARFWGRNNDENWYRQPYAFRIRLEQGGFELEPPELVRPEDGAEVAGGQIGFSWNSVRGAELYHFQLSIDANFNDLAFEDDEIDRLGINLNGFPDDGIDFWWRVRAGADGDWSDWSDVWSFENGGDVPRPDPPELSSPENGDFAEGETINFEWFTAEGATNYHLQLAVDEDFENLAYNNAVGNRTEFELEGFPNDYLVVWWRVRSGNNQGWSGWSDEWLFINGEEPGGVPDQPQLVTPDDGAFVSGEDLDFEWELSRWAFTYYMQIAVDEDFENLVFDDNTGNFLGVGFEGFPDDNTEFWWRVIAGNNRGWSDWSDEWKFTNGERPDRAPAAPQLSRPEDEEVVAGDEIEFSWNRPNTANRFRMELAIGANFDEVIFEGEFGNFTAVTLVGFPENGMQYWWRAKAGNFRGWSNWSDEWSFFSGDGPEDVPESPDLINPENDAFVPSEEIDFSWEEANFATNYLLNVAIDEDFEFLVFDNEVGNRNSVTLINFPINDDVFYWRVRSENVRGWGDWSNIWSFTNGEEPDNVPNPPDLVSPEDDSFINSENIEFSWQRSESANNYRLEISLEDDPEVVIFDEELGNFNEVTFEGFPLDNTEFLWRVCAENIRGWSDWSEVWMFTNGQEPEAAPEPPQLVAPDNNGFMPGEEIDFEWEISDFANNYQLQLALNQDFDNEIFSDEIGNFNQVTLQGFSNINSEIWWRVKAGNIIGWSDWSGSWMFTNGEEPEDAPEAPELIDPENDAVISEVEIEFTWSRVELANNFQLQISEDDEFNQLFFDEELGNLTSILIDGFPNDNSEFWWRVRAGNIRGWGDWSMENRFVNGAETEIIVRMHEGWNMMSINVSPSEEMYVEGEDRGPDVVRMTAQLWEGDEALFTIFKDMSGDFYAPFWDFCNIDFWDLTNGYMIKSLREMDAVWTGEPIAADADLPLHHGWNMVAYYPQYELESSAPDFYVLSPIIDQVILAKDIRGRFMTPAWEFSSMLPWSETNGYMIKLEGDAVLNYPPQLNDRVAAVSVEPETGQEAILTTRNMSILINNVLGVETKAGDQINAISADGRVVGAGVVGEDVRCGLAVWGDDPLTDDIEGLKEDEAFTLTLVSAEDNTSHSLALAQVLAGKGAKYINDDLTVLDVHIESQIPENYYLAEFYPNPFNGTTRLIFGLPEQASVRIAVYDMQGRLVTSLLNENLQAGVHSVVWQAKNEATGVYIVKMDAGNFQTSRKIVLMN